MNELKNRFLSLHPDQFFLEYSVETVNNYLSEQNWLLDKEYVTGLEKPGEGNMNLVMRVITNQRSLILKQARPWVEKFPLIEAPVERNHVEAAYFTFVGKDPVLHSFSPEILAHDPFNYLLCLNDLGESADFTYLYNRETSLKSEHINDLVSYLSALHHLDCRNFPLNQSMRVLNHEYIFRVPFRENNGLDLDRVQPGLSEASIPYKKNEGLQNALDRLGKFYLSEGPVLIHGDFFPGSWLQTRSGIKIIDPEFGFKGFAEFDLGVMIAHMVMSGQKNDRIQEIIERYHHRDDLDTRLLAGFAGTEILRRVLGVAQLPLTFSLEEKKYLMQMAEEWILDLTIKPL